MLCWQKQVHIWLEMVLHAVEEIGKYQDSKYEWREGEKGSCRNIFFRSLFLKKKKAYISCVRQWQWHFHRWHFHTWLTFYYDIIICSYNIPSYNPTNSHHCSLLPVRLHPSSFENPHIDDYVSNDLVTWWDMLSFSNPSHIVHNHPL